MKTVIFVVAMLMAGCATAQADRKPCGSFDTDRLRADLKAPTRTDREWHEALIKELAWQLDCERRAASAISTCRAIPVFPLKTGITTR